MLNNKSKSGCLVCVCLCACMCVRARVCVCVCVCVKNHITRNLMDAIPLCFNIEVYVFMSITQQKIIKMPVIF